MSSRQWVWKCKRLALERWTNLPIFSSSEYRPLCVRFLQSTQPCPDEFRTFATPRFVYKWIDSSANPALFSFGALSSPWIRSCFGLCVTRMARSDDHSGRSQGKRAMLPRTRLGGIALHTVTFGRGSAGRVPLLLLESGMGHHQLYFQSPDRHLHLVRDDPAVGRGRLPSPRQSWPLVYTRRGLQMPVGQETDPGAGGITRGPFIPVITGVFLVLPFSQRPSFRHPDYRGLGASMAAGGLDHSDRGRNGHVLAHGKHMTGRS
ncbi:hypothetical protein MAPG_00029 [Magnaporthiopsis poae ATCC 64411]|uniref:Uncharacterized protein n=1 Tax=Magnaporthiopsis poae (strain ATCC 64411 / 73-15) TaxID=644358 RepID=A0A0C4DJX0_MAGP6|nr:hypothetical protein MAPG_00029 [Magnaporthiopsis poae ATCC 64411]